MVLPRKPWGFFGGGIKSLHLFTLNKDEAALAILQNLGNKDVKASDSSPQVMEERQPRLKIIPVTSPGNDDRREKSVAMHDRYGKEVEEKGAKVIDLHVQPNEEPRRTVSTEAEKRPTEIHVRKVNRMRKSPVGKNLGVNLHSKVKRQNYLPFA